MAINRELRYEKGLMSVKVLNVILSSEERHTVFLWISTWKAKSQNASNPLKRKLDQIFSVWHAGNTVLSLFRPPFEGKVYITE